VSLLRAAFHRPRGVFEPLFDRVGRVPHAAAPCCMGSLRVAHDPAPEGDAVSHAPRRAARWPPRGKAPVPSCLSSRTQRQKRCHGSAPPRRRCRHAVERGPASWGPSRWAAAEVCYSQNERSTDSP
jgi:hypothetical protein